MRSISTEPTMPRHPIKPTFFMVIILIQLLQFYQAGEA
jgi:hypothetical protein